MEWNGGFVVNKAKMYCVASAVAVCVASNPSMDVVAKHLQPVQLEEEAQQTISAEDFIKNYLSTKEIVKDNENKDIEIYTLITQVDEKNCTSVFNGDQLFKELTEKNQNEIKEAYETAYKNAGMIKEAGCTLSAYEIIIGEANKMISDAKNELDLLVKESENLDGTIYTANTYATLKNEMDTSKALIESATTNLEQLKEEQVKVADAKNALIDISGLKNLVGQSNYAREDYTRRSYRAYETNLNQANKVLDNGASTVEEIMSAQDGLNAAVGLLVKKADFSALTEKVQEGYNYLSTHKNMLAEESYANFKAELEACDVVLLNDESTQEKIDETLTHLNAYYNDNNNFEYKVMTLESNSGVVPQDSLLDEPQLETTALTQEQSRSVQVNTPTKALTTVADNFIKTYLTSADGNVFTTANYLNYQKILSAMPSWLKLSKADQSAVNTELVNKVGKRYQRLLQEAQNLKMSSGKSGVMNINTSTNADTTLYTWLGAMSLGMLTFVLKRLRKQD